MKKFLMTLSVVALSAWGPIVAQTAGASGASGGAAGGASGAAAGCMGAGERVRTALNEMLVQRHQDICDKAARRSSGRRCSVTYSGNRCIRLQSN